jgi:hypothetical protein
MIQEHTSSGQKISILEEILGEKKPARKWYQKYTFLRQVQRPSKSF